MMKIPRRFAFLMLQVLLLVLLAGCSDQLSEFDVGVAGDGDLSSALEHIRGEHELPALSAVLVRSGEITEMETVGVRAVGSLEPATVHDRWHIGSITKSMTALLAGTLVDEGVIQWETTIGEVFPDLSESVRPEYKDVRLEELLSQTSGIPGNEMQIPSYTTSRQSTDPLTEQRRRWTAELLALEPDAPRGTHRYANANYVVAGAMLESVTGESWEELLRQKVLNPLGMTATGFGAPGTPGDVPDEPRGHHRRDGKLQPLPPGLSADNPPAVGPAGTVHTTLIDLARYIAVHLTGARGEEGIVSAKTFRKLHSAAPGTGYALGWSVGKHSKAGGRVISHNGSNGAWFARMWIAPERDFAILTLTNVGGDAGAKGADDALRALIDRCNARFKGS
jgi:CubicO group peptidase (beta-lactamase class C family)